MGEVDDLLNSFPESQSRALWGVHDTLLELLPQATIDMSWGMPTFRCEGIIITSLLGFAHHNSLFPGPEAIDLMGDALAGYVTTKGTIHFEKEKAPPKAFLKKVITARIAAINASYPKKSGQFLELYNNGIVKAKGKYRSDHMHGAWTFYRTDGTLMRSGSFVDGRQVGVWTTYDRDGHPHRRTQMDA